MKYILLASNNSEIPQEEEYGDDGDDRVLDSAVVHERFADGVQGFGVEYI